MKLSSALVIIAAAIPVSAFAQQDLSSSNRDSTQNGVLSGTTTNSMRDDYGTQVPSTQPVAPSQTSATNKTVNAKQMPAQQIPAQPMNGVPAGTVSGTTQAPTDAGATAPAKTGR